jgi:hypothetical protein
MKAAAAMSSTGPYVRTALVAPELLSQYVPADAPVLDLLKTAETSEALITGLLDLDRQDALMPALLFMLPKREAIWWGCLMARLQALQTAQPISPIIANAERWLQSGDEDLRYACYEQAEQDGFESVTAWIGMAVYWSGPSIAPRGEAAVKPKDSLTWVAVKAAMDLAVHAPVQSGPLQVAQINDIGLEIARGGTGRDAWTKLRSDLAAPPSPETTG